jgi:hypothetical protein
LVEAIFEWRVNKVEKDGIIEPNQRQMLRTYLTNFLNGKETENEQAHLLLEALDSYCQETERGALSLDIEVEGLLSLTDKKSQEIANNIQKMRTTKPPYTSCIPRN